MSQTLTRQLLEAKEERLQKDILSVQEIIKEFLTIRYLNYEENAIIDIEKSPHTHHCDISLHLLSNNVSEMTEYIKAIVTDVKSYHNEVTFTVAMTDAQIRDTIMQLLKHEELFNVSETKHGFSITFNQ